MDWPGRSPNILLWLDVKNNFRSVSPSNTKIVSSPVQALALLWIALKVSVVQRAVHLECLQAFEPLQTVNIAAIGNKNTTDSQIVCLQNVTPDLVPLSGLVVRREVWMFHCRRGIVIPSEMKQGQLQEFQPEY